MQILGRNAATHRRGKVNVESQLIAGQNLGCGIHLGHPRSRLRILRRTIECLLDWIETRRVKHRTISNACGDRESRSKHQSVPFRRIRAEEWWNIAGASIDGEDRI